MTKPILQFAHANSYPAGTCRVFFDHLRCHYEVQALDLDASNPKFPVPVGFVGGAESVECGMAGLNTTKRLVGGDFRLIPGSHLFPMESPALATQVTHEILRSLTQSHSCPKKPC
jgi:hypothetical protein